MMNLTEFVKKPVFKFKKSLKMNLFQAEIKQNETIYLFNSFKYGFFVFLFLLAGFFSFFDNVFFGIIVCFVFGVFVVFLRFFYPVFLKRKRAARIEKDLPFFLMALSVQVNVCVPLEKAIENIALREKNELGKEFLLVVKQVKEAGVSLQKALLGFALRVDSLMLKRALVQIVGVYEQEGTGKAESLRSLAKEQLSMQKAQLREFGGKIVFYSLVFIAVSTIIPTLFQSIVFVGSSFMELDFSPLQVLLIVTIGFPVLDVLTLFFIRAKTPEFLK